MKFVSTLLFAGLAIGQLSADTVDVVFTSANGQQDSSGYLISPYYASVNGANTTIFCDDFANEVYYGQEWTANFTNLGTGDLSNLRYDNISQTLATSPTTTATFSGFQLYEMAAWLTTQFAPSGSAGYSQNGDIQDTIWDLFNPNSYNPGVNPPTPSSNTWLYAAENNYSTINASSFSILTNTGVTYSGAGQVQEFITASPTPEPSSVLLLGMGLLGVTFFGRRILARANSKNN